MLTSELHRSFEKFGWTKWQGLEVASEGDCIHWWKLQEPKLTELIQLATKLQQRGGAWQLKGRKRVHVWPQHVHFACVCVYMYTCLYIEWRYINGLQCPWITTHQNKNLWCALILTKLVKWITNEKEKNEKCVFACSPSCFQRRRKPLKHVLPLHSSFPVLTDVILKS